MAVTYAWKIDSKLYSYIVNPNCLSDNGLLLSTEEYLNNPDDDYRALNEEMRVATNPLPIYQEIYMGYVSPEPINEKDNGKVQDYCKVKFATKNKYALANYTAHFDKMLDKIHAYSGGEEGYPYAYVDLQEPEKYFNIDSDCGDLTGAKGQPAILRKAYADFDNSSGVTEPSFNVEVRERGTEYVSYNENKIHEKYNPEQFSGITWKYGNVSADTDGSFITFTDESGNTYSPTDVNTPEFIFAENTGLYWVREDIDPDKNEYDIYFKLALPKNDGVYNPNSELVSDENKLSSGTIEMPITIGGISSGTTLADLSGKCFSEILNMLLFPEMSPAVATKPGIKVGKYVLTKIVGLGDIIQLVKPGFDKIEGAFNGIGYDAGTPNYESGEITITPVGEELRTLEQFSAVTKGDFYSGWTASYIYSAPSNSPLTSRGKEYTGSEATWVAGTAATSALTHIYVVNPILYNVDSGITTEENDYPIKISGKTFEFTIKTVNYPLSLTFPNPASDYFKSISIWNDTSKVWNEQSEGVTNQYQWDGNTLKYNTTGQVATIAGKYKLELKKELYK